ncbi:hypothetical protein J3R83DRAFT_8039 [Lanmaoa asiatica]|nr:hypothetical protein J3R83DRAFT_8039 [Lanmaoa asiatica]
MKLMLRPEWRLWPIVTFIGILDIKTGVTIALLFAAAGGSFAQLSLYLYSLLGLVALGWGLKAVKEENAQQTLYFAHLFFVDHMFSTAWTLFFAVAWWVYTPHDGRRVVNSAAQEAIRLGAGVNHTMDESQSATAANILWDEEKGSCSCGDRPVLACKDILCAPAVFVCDASTQGHVQLDTELAFTFFCARWLRSSFHGGGRRQRRVLHVFIGNTPSQWYLFTFTRLRQHAGKERTSFRKTEPKLTSEDYNTRAGERGGSLRGKRTIIPSYLPPNMLYGPVF